MRFADPDSALPVLLAWSGGKDSTLALAALRDDPQFRVIGLLTTVSRAYDRISIHGVRRTILQAQAAALGLPLFEAWLETPSSNEDYNAAWARGIGAAHTELGPFEHVAYGDLFLEDVRGFREQQAARLGYTPLFPLWGRGTAELAHHFVQAGYEAYLTCVDTTQLDPGFAGRRFDEELLADLPQTVDPCGERGEFHTCVVGGPVFAHAIPVVRGERVRRDDRFEYCDLVPVSGSGMSTKQSSLLWDLIDRSPVLCTALDGAARVMPADWYLGAGCIAQTVWNHLCGRELMADIKDLDLVYYDGTDLSEGAEDRYIERVRQVLGELSVHIDVKNQARVHLWYERRFGYPIKPYVSLEDAVNSWPTSATCVGVRRTAGEAVICAPYGLDDLFSMVVRPNKKQITEEIYAAKSRRWKGCWPALQVIPW